MPAYDLSNTLGAPFFGFVLGVMLVHFTANPGRHIVDSSVIFRLFGITILQVYQYFSNYSNDPRFQKLAVCTLNHSKTTFSMSSPR